MNKRFIKDGVGWGFGLWLIGYILGFAFFFVLPPAYIGCAVTPIGTAITLWVLFKKVEGGTLGYYVALGAVWAAIAIALDYFFLVKLLNPADGYYKLDVYLYYVLAFALPVFVGLRKKA